MSSRGLAPVCFLRAWTVLVLALGGGLSAEPTATPDLTLTMRAQARVPGTLKTAPVPQRLCVNGRFLRISQGGSDFIIDSVSGRMVVVDAPAGTYAETSFDEMAAYIDGRIPKSPTVRRQMARMFADLTLEKQPDSRVIAGFPCDHYVEKVGPMAYHVWATTAIRPPDTFYAVMERVYAATSPVGNPMSPIYAHLRRIGAMPLEIDQASQKISVLDVLGGVVDTLGAAAGSARAGAANNPAAAAIAGAGSRPPANARVATETVSEVLEVSRDPIPPETFEVPAGLRKTDSPFAPKR